MTVYEFIQSKDAVDLAIFLVQLKQDAIDNYENGLRPAGIYETIKWLKSEAAVL